MLGYGAQSYLKCCLAYFWPPRQRRSFGEATTSVSSSGASLRGEVFSFGSLVKKDIENNLIQMDFVKHSRLFTIHTELSVMVSCGEERAVAKNVEYSKRSFLNI